MAKKRKGKTKKGRSPSMAARLNSLIDRIDNLDRDVAALTARVAGLESEPPTQTDEPAAA